MVAAAPAKSPATAYAEDVASGSVVAGPLIRAACQRHLRDLERQDTSGFPYVFDADREKRFSDFAGFVNLSEGVKFNLEPFQRFIVGSLFGWVDRNAHRRFRTAYIEIGKGNGKTPLAALVGLYGLIWDKEWQAEIYSAAVTRDQAGICFRDAHNMASGSPDLASRLEILGHNIAYNDSFFRVVSSEGRTLDGKRPHISLIDEIHEHRTGVVVQKMRAGMKRRVQPLVFEITNSGFDRTSICWEHHEHTRNVLEGSIADETWFGYVAGLDPEDDWHDEAVWTKANPGLDTILPRSYLREQVKEAESIASSSNLIQRLNFCVWTQSANKWLDLDCWGNGDIGSARTALRGRRCFAGLDLAATTDLAALVLAFPDEAGGYDVLPFFWLPEAAVRAKPVYGPWVRQGLIRTTPGNITDYDVIREDIRELAEEFDIAEIAYDRWNATQIVTQLTSDGALCVPIGQGFGSMSAPSKELEKLVVGGLLRHGGNPVLRWMASNVAVQEDPAGNIKPARDKSADKIDGIVALVMALSRSMVYQQAAPAWSGIYVPEEE